MDVDVKASVGVKLSVVGRLVEVEADSGDTGAEAGTCPLWDTLQADIVKIKMRGMKYFLNRMHRLYSNPLEYACPLSSSPRPEGGRSGRTFYSLACLN